MELKHREKHVEPPVMPPSWKSVRLDEIAEIRSGGTPATSTPGFWNGGVPWCTPTDITSLSGSKYLAETERTISQEGLRRSSAEVIPPHSVIMTTRATIGECAVNSVPMTTNQGFKNLIPSSVDGEFLYYLMTTQKERLINLCGGSTFLEVGRKQLQGFEVDLPIELDEQRAIAAALSDVDALLEGLDRLIAKKRDLKQAAMQQLLTGKTRLEGFDGEWTLRRLGDHVTFLKHGTNSRAELRPDGPIKYLHYGDIHASTLPMLDPTSLPSLPKEKAKSLDRLQDGDLVFADASEDVAGVSVSVEICDAGDTELVAGLHTIAARFDKNVLADGFKAYLRYCPTFYSHLRRLAAGTKVYATHRSHIASIEIRLPSIDEQSAIAAVFRDMDIEIAAFEQRRAKTADLKQAMMQELLTGRTRLVEPQDSEAEEASASQSGKGHNWAINEAVVIAALANHFGSETYPLGRKRYTKLAYLLHRHAEREAEGYLKKAAGPYNPQTKYGGPEKIAKKNRYIKQHKGLKGYSGFIAADNIDQAEGYFEKWYGRDTLDWLSQFRFNKNDDLEVLTTVDMAVGELRSSGRNVDVDAVKDVISSHSEWEAKLDRAAFSDANIAKAIETSRELFSNKVEH